MKQMCRICGEIDPKKFFEPDDTMCIPCDEQAAEMQIENMAEESGELGDENQDSAIGEGEL